MLPLKYHEIRNSERVKAHYTRSCEISFILNRENLTQYYTDSPQINANIHNLR